jgi:glycosyltransferase involved in cell wall biosynthesis
VKKYLRKVRNVAYTQSKKALKNTPAIKKIVVKTAKAAERLTGLKLLIKDNYELWLKNHTLSKEELKIQTKKSKKLSYRPLISIVTPVYNTHPIHLEECIDCVLNQTYDNWELILVDDKSTNNEPKEIIQKYADTDDRIKAVFNKKNLHISGATNEGIKVAKGEYIALLDHDDVLYPHALFSVVKSLQNIRHDFVYSDEDKISENSKVRSNPFFKPDWSPDFLRSINYITHFTVIKKSLINKVGGFRSQFDGAQDWDLFLRTTREANSIYHIQDILYGWRMSSNSTAQNTEAKPYVVKAQKLALQEDVRARGYRADVVTSRYIKDYWEVNYKVKGNPVVSIIIPTKNQYKVVKRCIDSILDKSTYNNYEIILVDTGSTEHDVINWYKKLKNKKIKQLSFVEDKFSYANTCNYGASKASGEYLIMLNNDTEVITPNWIELMLGDAQRREVGTVGARLYFPGNTQLQHAGVGIGLGGYAANLLGAISVNNLDATQKIYADNKRNVAANTAACIMIKSRLFKNLKGFDNKFSVTYNDVDLGLRLLKNGYVNVYNPSAELTHHESISLGLPEQSKRDSVEFNQAKDLLKKRWQTYITNDPYLNMHYSKGYADFTITD